ncbi:MAG: hypothetical protein QNJ54_36215 [Prochloraceae cyanobacterium]|nr:hypothetical protein [Prochloraceae cyanobacterium]
MTEKPKSNGHREKYDPKVVYEYLDADVWTKEEPKKSETKSVAYSDEVLEALEQDNEEDDESSEEDS